MELPRPATLPAPYPPPLRTTPPASPPLPPAQVPIVPADPPPAAALLAPRRTFESRPLAGHALPVSAELFDVSWSSGLLSCSCISVSRCVSYAFCARCIASKALHYDPEIPRLASCDSSVAPLPELLAAVRLEDFSGHPIPCGLLLRIVALDLFTGGLPCGFFYHGLGTAWAVWSWRRAMRFRYHLKGTPIADLLVAVCLPPLGVRQIENQLHRAVGPGQLPQAQRM
jgi:hypothetical protein